MKNSLMREIATSKTRILNIDSGTVRHRFWSYVVIQDGCWRWIGLKKKGYGLIGGKRGEPQVGAHRVSWMIHFGPIPDGLLVCHHCDNPECTNPKHLFLGTQQDNMADATRKGRMKVPGKGLYGEKNYQAKLNREKVCEIRRMYADGKTQRLLADRFEVSQSVIFKVVNNITWASSVDETDWDGEELTGMRWEKIPNISS